MKTFSIISSRNLYICILACALTLLLTSTANAQKITDGSTPLGVSPGAPTGSYALSDFDSANLYNGSLSFRLPLVRIAGRGGAGYSMIMRIEKKWVVEKELGLGQPNRYTPTTEWWGPDGQEPIYSVGKMEMRQAAIGESFSNRETLTRLTFTSPDGTEYELRDQLTNGQPYHPATGPEFNRGRVFVTSDGSAATFTSDADILDYRYDNPGNFPPSGYLMMRDGTRYRIDGGRLTWMRDRNGNKVRFDYDTAQRLATVTDSLNRQVTITYADQNTPYDQIIVKGFGGAARSIKIYRGSALRSDCSALTYQQLFPELNGASNSTFTPGGVTAVQLPNGQQYQFFYNSYSELARVVLPTGGAIEYDYAPGLTDGTSSGVITMAGNKQVYRRVIERRVYPDGGSGLAYESKMTYSRPETSSSNAGYVVTDQYSSGGARLGRSNHYFYGSPRASFGQQPTQYSGWRDGREYQTIVFAADGTTPLRQVNSVFAQRASVTWWTGSSDQEPPNDPRPIETTTALLDTNQISKQTFGYDDTLPFNNQNYVKEYDFGNGAPGPLVRETRTTYVTSSSYVGPETSILSLPEKVSVYDAGGIERARTTFEYDNYNSYTNHATLQTYPRPGFSEPPMSGLDPAFNSSSNNLTRGNVTATTHYLLDDNAVVTGSIASYTQYDIAGNTVKAIDARGYATTLDFSDNFGTPDGEARSNAAPLALSSQVQASYAFVTSATNAIGQTTHTQFDYYLGRAIDVEDINGVVSSGYSENEPLDRPTKVIRAVNQNASVKSQVTFIYDDANHTVTTKGDQSAYGDNLIKSETVYDGLGRTIETHQYESSTNYIAVKQVPFVVLQDPDTGIWVSAIQASNPYRPYLGEQPVWTTTFLDALGRTSIVRTSDNAIVRSIYSGNSAMVIDQHETGPGRSRKSVTDALGRLKTVYEDPSGLNYMSSYEYDVLDDLTVVSQYDSATQHTQTRTSVYDSLKRLASSSNVENGTVNYQYDENGNLRVRTDARGVSTHYSYDALNRVMRRWYNGSTSPTEATNNFPALPADVATSDEVAYFYDSQGLPPGAPNFSRGYATGHLVAVTYGTGSSAGDYYGYDGAGRGVLKIQQTSGSNYQVSAEYNLANAITTLTYPSGHSVNYGYDRAGRTSNMTGRLGDGRNRTYSTGISYSPFGGLSQEQFGTQTSLYHKMHYNARGQLYDIRVSTYSLQTNEFDWNRGCLALYYGGYAWGQSGPANNGNITSSQHWVPFNDGISNYSYTQDNFSYDSLNRLSSTSEIHGGPNSQSGQDYVQSYDYDRWGNRTINSGSSSVINHTQFDKSDAQNTNQLYAPGDISLPMSQRKMQYDSAGNLTHDSYTGDNRARSYDAENRLSVLSLPPVPPVCYPDGEGGLTCYPVDPGPSQAPIQYVYDGDGHRVRRFIHDQETRQVYGFSGELLAEYSASTSPATLQKEYGYRNGQLLITAAPGYGSSGSIRHGSPSNTSALSADLLARNSGVELPEWMRGFLSANISAASVSDSSTPLYGPRFPYASLNSSVLPVMPQSGISKIAFASNREGTAQVYSMNTDGSGALRLTNDAANDESPRWSPNGSRIVFQSDRDNVFSGMADIYVMNADGSGQTRLTSDANDDSAPVWSPNGSKIAFQSARSGVSYQVYTMNSDGSGQVNISNNGANDKQPSWSPDVTKIAFASDRDQAGFSSIYVMNANGTSQTRLTISGSGFRDEQPVWSPDGTKLAFTTTRDSSVVTWDEWDGVGNLVVKTKLLVNKEVYVMNADGSAQVRLTNTQGNDDSPVWSTDGAKIAFRSDRDRDCCDPVAQVWVMNADGSNAVDLSNNGFGEYSPNWSNIMTPPPPPNGAQFVSQSVPQTMIAGQSYSVSVTMQNIGSNTWTSASNYNLGSQNAQDNTTWGLGRVGLPSSVGSGTQVTFNFTVTAPATSGTYNFQWRMVQDGVEWFGAFTPNLVVTVNGQSGGNPNPEPDPSTPMADVRWIVADQLGTPRMIFDQSGSLAGASRHDYLPFGEELTGQIGGRTTQQGYTGDSTREKFTGYERDGESGLDYAHARYYGSVQGRFTGVDPVDGNVGTPQTFNRYSYVLNNPISLTDPNGLMVADASMGWSDVSDGFWGKDLGAENRRAGSEIIAARQVQSDSAIGDALNAKSINEGLRSGRITPQQALALVENDPNLGMERVTASAEITGVAGEPQSLGTILLIVGDPGLGTHNQGRNFDRVAETKRQELTALGYNVVKTRASGIADVNKALTSNGVLAGVEYIGHASMNVLFVGEQPGAGTNIDLSNVSQLSNANLSPNAYIKINACFSGYGGWGRSIAGGLANHMGRPVLAFNGATIFSGSETRRTAGKFAPSTGPLYLIEDAGTRLVTYKPSN